MITWTGRWAASKSDRIYHQLQARNKNDAIEEAKKWAGKSYKGPIWIAKAYKYEPHIDAEYVIDDLKHQLSYEFSSACKGILREGSIIIDDNNIAADEKYLDSVTNDLVADLGGRLNRTLRNWEKYHKLCYCRFIIKDGEYIVIDKE